MRKLLRKFIFLFYRIYALRVISKDSVYTYSNTTVKIPKGVFHPGLFFSTTFLLDELLGLSLTGKSFLELGCGSGLIAVIASKNGAVTTAVDLNDKAVNATLVNATNNGVNVNAVQSDLFSALQKQEFDIIAINPPYYKKNPSGYVEAAWFAGENLEYFKNLFSQIGAHTHANSKVFMVVSEDVCWNEIVKLAAAHHIAFSLVREKTIFLERNFIYQLNIKR